MKDSGPLFSIVTVTLNCASAASRTATSVCSQDCRDFEYLVKDGGSGDGTVSVVAKLDPKIRTISQPDRGIYDAMNQAIKHCRGQYVCFLNAGDTFVDRGVLSAVGERVTRRPDISLWYGDVVTHHIHPVYGAPDPSGHLQQAPSAYSRLNAFLYPFCHQAWFVRTALYRQRLLNTKYLLSADLDFFLYWILEQNTDHVRIPMPVVDYAGGGASDQDPEQLRGERARVVEEYFSPGERVVFGIIRRVHQAVRVAGFAITRVRPMT